MDAVEAVGQYDSVDEAQNTSQINMLQKCYAKISKEVIAVTDHIFQPRHEHADQDTFTVKEMELMVPENRKAMSKNHDLICPNAGFPHQSSSCVSETLSFSCFCKSPAASHDGQMEYRVKNTTFLVERLDHTESSTWQMILDSFGTMTVVSVIISGVGPESARRFRDISVSLAFDLTLPLFEESRVPQIWPPRVVPAAGCVLVLSSICDPAAFVRRLPARVQVYTPHGPVVLAWRPQFIQACHYMAVLDDDEAYSDAESLPPRTIRPQGRVRLVVGKERALKDPQVEDAIVADISKDSSIITGNHRLGPLWVTLSEVEMHGGGRLLGYSQLDLQFGCLQDAENFVAHITALRQRLLQSFCQSAFSDETEVYVNESDVTSPGSNETRIETKVIMSSSSSTTGTQRMVVKNKASQASLCLDFGEKVLEVAQNGLQNSQDLVRFWLHDYSEKGIPRTERTNWSKLLQRRPMPVLHRSILGGAQVTRDGELSSEDWLDGIDDLRVAMAAPPSVEGSYRRVKVCVIDTGFDKGDLGKSMVKVFRDFVSPGNTGLCDETGHGTMSATTILSIYEECELYVARVLRTNNTDNVTEPALMADAIEWAIAPAQDVDIISISAGFQNHSPRLQEAVQRASGANKLVFAAASNWGNANPVAYPARHELYTMCIFSTDVCSRASRFNPEHRPDTYNFALLGEGWRLGDRQGTSIEGTSVATAAAAGLAALIVDFSRHADNAGIVRVGDVGKMLGMIAVFNAMHVRAGGFKCVVPRRLLPLRYEEMELAARRRYVRESISRAMEQAN